MRMNGPQNQVGYGGKEKINAHCGFMEDGSGMFLLNVVNHLPTRLHWVTTQKTTIHTFTALKTPNLIPLPESKPQLSSP
jgi:hypothetical protein